MPNTETWIDEIQGDNNTVYRSGSIFSRIFYDDNNQVSTYSLKNFFDTVKNFFLAPMHMIYKNNEPINFSIKEWYKVKTLNNNQG